MRELVLSVFPGIDLLGRAFEEEGYCIVRGPDVLWGGDIHNFHPPRGVFQGVIGGPPCPFFSRLRFLNPLCGQKEGNLIPEFCRVVDEAAPLWWLMENTRESPIPELVGYQVKSWLLNNRWFGGEQHRVRRITFGHQHNADLQFDVALFEAPVQALAVTSSQDAIPVKLGGSGKVKASLKPVAVLAGHGPYDRGDGTSQYPKRTWAEMCELQGLPGDFLSDSPFTATARRQLIGNGVPMTLGRAIAGAIRKIPQLG